jgi:hypothetical protein
MLSDTSMQVQAHRSSSLAIQAQTLAESGVHLAMYYLVNPWKAPSLTNGYWPGSTGNTLGSAVPGTFDVTVARVGASGEQYTITSLGKVTEASGGTITRTIQTTVIAHAGLSIFNAITAPKDVTLASNGRVTGNVRINGKLTTWATIDDGRMYARSFDIREGSALNAVTLGASDTVDVPLAGSIQTYATYPYSDGRVYNRQTLALSAIGNGVSPTLGATAGNPAGIYYYNGNFTLNNNVTITGTLIVNGTLYVNGANITITAKDGYPALMVFGEIRTKGTSRAMTVNGASWVQKTIKADSGTSTGTVLTFNGALLFGDAANIELSAGSQVKAIYNTANLILPDWDKNLARYVTVKSWKE